MWSEAGITGGHGYPLSDSSGEFAQASERAVIQTPPGGCHSRERSIHGSASDSLDVPTEAETQRAMRRRARLWIGMSRTNRRGDAERAVDTERDRFTFAESAGEYAQGSGALRSKAERGQSEALRSNAKRRIKRSSAKQSEAIRIYRIESEESKRIPYRAGKH